MCLQCHWWISIQLYRYAMIACNDRSPWPTNGIWGIIRYNRKLQDLATAWLDVKCPCKEQSMEKDTRKTWVTHDDVIKWKHFPRYWPFGRRIHRSPVNSPHKVQWSGDLMFSLICDWINGWVNNSEADDLRRHRYPLWHHCNEHFTEYYGCHYTSMNWSQVNHCK